MNRTGYGVVINHVSLSGVTVGMTEILMHVLSGCFLSPFSVPFWSCTNMAKMARKTEKENNRAERAGKTQVFIPHC
jgi:hypothetical protein